MSNPSNLCAMHRATCERLGPRTALRYRRHGMYRDLNWNDYRLAADRAAGGLIGLGVKPGDRIAILSENRYEWLIADHAILSAGAVNVPLHAPLAPSQVEYQVGHSGACGIIVSGQQQAEKVWQVLASLPHLKFVIAFDPIARGPIPTLPWQGLVMGAAGRTPFSTRAAFGGPHGSEKTSDPWHPDEVLRRAAAITPDHLATIIYTSGTTGNPKGVMLTHENLVSNASASLERLSLDQTDILLSWLPYSHIYARTIDHYTTTLGGMTVCLGGPVERLMEDLRLVNPTWLTSVPRFYEKLWSSVQGLPAEQRHRRLREIFPRIKQLTSGGAPLPRPIAEGFHEAGLPLLEGYGLTESSPVISFNSRRACRVGSVGLPVRQVQVRIAADGEILTRGPHVMKGYWKNPLATAESIEEGWLHTGDVGRIDADGFLFITDRKKDLIITAGGKNIAPAELERLLVSDPYIDQAVVYGDGRPFVSALIVPNFDQLHGAARAMGCEVSPGNDFIGEPRIVELYRQRLAALMENVSQPERVKKFLLLARPLNVEAEELTATLKVRRRYILAKFEPHLKKLYEQSLTAEAAAMTGVVP